MVIMKCFKAYCTQKHKTRSFGFAAENLIIIITMHVLDVSLAEAEWVEAEMKNLSFLCSSRTNRDWLLAYKAMLPFVRTRI